VLNGLVGKLDRLRFQIARSATGALDAAMRILAVDDNLVNLKVAEKQLERLGYRVDPAAGGRAALDALSTTRYAVVLFDCEMPEIDGYATTAEIRRRHSDERHTVILAAHALEGARSRCLDAGIGRLRRQASYATSVSRSPGTLRLVGEEGG
jgi:CheY-like chemotaxis protein